MEEYEISVPKKTKELIKLNTFPKKNPNKEFDPILENKTPKKLYTPLYEIKKINLIEKIVNLTNTDKQIKKKPETAPWLRKFTFTGQKKLENRANRSLNKVPLNYEKLFEESFIDVDENLESVNFKDFLPGNENYSLFDCDEENFEIVSMEQSILGYPKKVFLKSNDEINEFDCIANNLQDHYLIEVNENGAFYYPVKNSLKLKKIIKKK